MQKCATVLRLRNANVPNGSSFQGLLRICNISLLSIPGTEKNALKRPKPLSKSYTGKTKKSGIICKFIFPPLFEPVSAALLLLETAVIAPVWIMILLEADAVVGDGYAIDRTI